MASDGISGSVREDRDTIEAPLMASDGTSDCL